MPNSPRFCAPSHSNESFPPPNETCKSTGGDANPHRYDDSDALSSAPPAPPPAVVHYPCQPRRSDHHQPSQSSDHPSTPCQPPNPCFHSSTLGNAPSCHHSNPHIHPSQPIVCRPYPHIVSSHVLPHPFSSDARIRHSSNSRAPCPTSTHHQHPSSPTIYRHSPRPAKPHPN